MKRIAIFCDGTWLESSGPHASNVLLLAQAVLGTAPDGTKQQVIYLQGVGTGRGSTGVGRLIERNAGGALGWGLDAAIEDAYRTLVFSYEPGDEVYVFGFSRGAYTARSLVGLIRRSGILLRAHVNRVPEAMANYRTRGDRATRAIGRRSLLFRAEYAHVTATVRHEAAWRRAWGGLPAPRVDLRLPFLGVWDTVGALGIPERIVLSRLVNGRYQFHDTALSPLVETARHAVAVDERRVSFVPTLWDNLPAMNRRAPAPRPERGLGAVPASGPRYRQEWFPGDHGSVGGGSAWTGLSSYAALWIAEGAAEAGLEFDEASLDNIRHDRDIREQLTTRSEGGLFGRLWRLADRTGPTDPCDVSDAVRERVAACADYAPPTLKEVLPALRPGAPPA